MVKKPVVGAVQASPNQPLTPACSVCGPTLEDFIIIVIILSVMSQCTRCCVSEKEPIVSLLGTPCSWVGIGGLVQPMIPGCAPAGAAHHC